MPDLVLREAGPGRFELHLDTEGREVLAFELGSGRHRLGSPKTTITRGDETVAVFQRDCAVFRGARVKLRDVLFAQTTFGVPRWFRDPKVGLAYGFQGTEDGKGVELVTEEDEVIATFSAGDRTLPFRCISLSPSAVDPSSLHRLLSRGAPTPLLERTLVAYLLYQSARANGWKDSRRPGRDETESRGPLWSTMIWAFLPRAPSWN